MAELADAADLKSAGLKRLVGVRVPLSAPNRFHVPVNPGFFFRGIAELQTHLILWNAKYDIWITDHPERALVYMVDEQAHGIGFPSGIDEAVTNSLTVI